MTAPRRSWVAETLFAVALRAYPRAFRRRFGDEMRDDFRRRGTLAFGSLVRHGLAERWAAVVRWSFFPNATPHLYEPSGRHAMFWDTVRADLRFAIRQALQAPLYTSLAVVALALGIGANSAIFTVVQGVLLKPLPYRDPGQLVMVWSHNTKEDKPENPISPANFGDLRDEARSFATLERLLLLRHQHPARARRPARDGRHLVCRARACSNCSAARRCSAARSPMATAPGISVLSHGYWQRRFGGDPSVVGRTGDRRRPTGDDRRRHAARLRLPVSRAWSAPPASPRTMDVDAWTPMLLTGPRIVDQSGRFVRNVH